MYSFLSSLTRLENKKLTKVGKILLIKTEQRTLTYGGIFSSQDLYHKFEIYFLKVTGLKSD